MSLNDVLPYIGAAAALGLILFFSFDSKSREIVGAKKVHWPPSILLGADDNLSTSKFAGWAWSLAIAPGAAYLLVRCATSDDLALDKAGLVPLNPGYLVLLDE